MGRAPSLTPAQKKEAIKRRAQGATLDELARDADFKANFEQKGVNMRIGLDIAGITADRRMDRVLLVSADADLIPAMKHARRSGLQVVGIQLPVPPANILRPQFLAHVDYKRDVIWPKVVAATAEMPIEAESAISSKR